MVYLLTGPLANFILNDVNKEYTRNIKNGINTPEGPFPPVIYDDNGDVLMTRPDFKSTDDNAKTEWKHYHMEWTMVAKEDKAKWPR